MVLLKSVLTVNNNVFDVKKSVCDVLCYQRLTGLISIDSPIFFGIVLPKFFSTSAKNIDDLFERPHLSAVQDLCGFILDDPNNHKNFNSGVMVVEPSTEDYQALIDILNNHDFGDRLIHDQLIMWEYWKDWADRKELHLPNYYNIWTSYFWPEDPYFAYPHDIKVLHIIDKKPWLQSKEYFRQFDNSYHIYMLLNLWYIDVLNWTIEDLKSKGITSPDLKIIK